VISIGGRLVIAADGIAQAVYQGLQEKPVSGSHSEASAGCRKESIRAQ
jgi:hypothetical protein